MKYILYAVFILSFSACSINSIGYFEVEPSRFVARQIDEPLYIDFGKEVKNNFNIDQAGISTLNVKEFKHSLGYALEHALSSQFKSINYYTGQQNGYILKVSQLKSSWLIGRVKHIVRDEFNDTLHIQDFTCFIRYTSILYHNKTYISEMHGEIRVKPDQVRIWKIDHLFQHTVKLACEDMARKLQTAGEVEDLQFHH